MSNFHLLQAVDRGSETQLQVGENVFFSVAAFMQQLKGTRQIWLISLNMNNVHH